MTASASVLSRVSLFARTRAARPGAALLLAGAVCVSTPASASPDALAGTLFGAGAGALVGQAVGGQQGAVVGGIVGAVAGHAVASSYDPHPRAHGGYARPHARGYAWSPYPPPPVVAWGVPPSVVYPPHAVVIAPRPVYAPVPATVVIPAPVHYWNRGYAPEPRHHRRDRHHRHHWD